LSIHSAGEQDGDTPRWRVCRDYRYHVWLDGAVVYDTASGDTHHLTPAAFRILSLLVENPHTPEEVARMLSSDVTAADDEGRAMIDATLAHLAELGLIEAI